METIKSNRITILSALFIFLLCVLSTMQEIPFIYQGANLLLISYMILYTVGFVLQNNHHKMFTSIDYSQIALLGTLGLGFNIFFFAFLNPQALDINRFEILNWLFHFNILLIFMLFYLAINKKNRKTETNLFSLTSIAVIISIILGSTSLMSGLSPVEGVFCLLSAMHASASMILMNNLNNRYSPLITAVD